MNMDFGFNSQTSKLFPELIVLENTNVCNLRCIHCPIGNGWTDKSSYKASYMKWNIYKKIIDEISNYKIEQLIFSPAGENFIHPEFIDQLDYAKQKKINKITIITNGLTLDNRAIINKKKSNITNIEAILRNEPEVINISLDAAKKETYKKIRIGSDYHRVWSNVHRLINHRDKKNYKTKIMLNIIQQEENNDEVNLFKEYWGNLADRILVRPYLTNLGLTPNKTKDKLPKRWPCPQLWKRITINVHGNLRFCVVDWDDKSEIKSLEHFSIKEIWNGQKYDELRSFHLKGDFKSGQSICETCTDWKGMRWDWGYEKALEALRGDKKIPDMPTPLD